MTPSLDRVRTLATVMVAAVVGAALVKQLPIDGGDTIPLAHSARALVACAQSSTWSHCPGVERFGLQQHLPAMFFAWKGFDARTNLTALTLVNLLAFAALLTMLVTTRSVASSARRLALLALLLGPALAYSIVSFGESLSIAVNGALVLAIADRRSTWLIAALAAYACTAKETAVVSVLLIGAAVLIGMEADRADDRRWWTVDRGRAVGLLFGCIAGVCLNAMFNIWRYGSLGNAVYDDPIFRTPGLWLKLKAFAALWVSPGGGALVYWFLGAVVVVGMPLLALLSRDRRRQAAGFLLLLGIAAQTALLSAWWSPFGWYAWGPRLLLPTLAMGLVAVVAVFQPELSLASRVLRKHVWGAAAVAALSLLSAAANLGFLANPDATLAWFYTPHTSACPRFPDFMSERAHYYDCVHGLMTWRPNGSLWTTGLSHVWSGGGIVLLSCVVVAVAAAWDFRGPSRTAHAANEGSPPLRR